MTTTLPEQKPEVVLKEPETKVTKLGFWQSFTQRTPLGWKQLQKNRGRLIVAIAGIGFADLLIFAQLGIQGALFESNTLLIQSLDADIVIRATQYRDLSLPSTFPRRRLFQIQNLSAVESAEAFYTDTIVWKNPQTQKKTTMTLAGQNIQRPGLTIPEITPHLDKLNQPDNFVFDQYARGEYAKVVEQVRQGKAVKTEIDRRTIEVVGLFPLGASFATDGTLITSQENFLRFFADRSAGQVTLGLVKVKQGADLEQVLAQIQAILPKDTIATTKQGYLDVEQAYWASNTPIGVIFGLGAGMAFVVGIVIVFQILSTDVNDHLGEYATFKAMGYGDRFIILIVLEEAMILAILGFIPGLALALGQYALIANVAALPISMTFARLSFVFFLTLLMCGVSGVIAMGKVRTADPADIF
ncbi:MAG: ABC transporter permease DevC [Pseudanabaenaceae cyanobacterium bins.68]|nr:ABC transporter permease DevC [Pseudanabaenaceae cyanobacterium bins.68]